MNIGVIAHRAYTITRPARTDQRITIKENPRKRWMYGRGKPRTMNPSKPP
jgi:hypothetical protein